MDSTSPIVKEKSQSNLRWLILLLNCFMMMGCYYASDIPAALKSPLKDWMGGGDAYETNYALLYTVYSIPNIILPLFGGFFVDKLGVRVCLVFFMFLVCIGQVIFSIGLSTKSWPVMFLGRALFGAGAESLGVGQGATLSQWFKGKEVALAFGISLSVSRLGSVTNNNVSPALATSTGIVFAGWFGAIMCGVSLACAIIIGIISKSFEASQEKDKQESLLANEDNEEEEVKLRDNEKEKKEEPVKLSDVKRFSIAFWAITLSCVIVYGAVLPFNNIAQGLLLERNYFVDTPSDCHLMDPFQCESSSNKPDSGCPDQSSYYMYQPPLPSNISASDIDCQDSYWKDEGQCGYYYCKDQADGLKTAATVMSIPYIISACLSPFLGGFVDKFGLRAIIATIVPIALVAVHGCIGYTKVNPIGPMVGQGLSYSAFAAVLWPSVPLVVEPKYTGLGFGIVNCVQNAGLALFPIIIAKIASDHDGKYIPYAENVFISLAVVGFLVGLYMNYYDYYHDGIFNKPTKSDGYKPLADEDEDVSVDSKNISKVVSPNDIHVKNTMHDN